MAECTVNTDPHPRRMTRAAWTALLMEAWRCYLREGEFYAVRFVYYRLGRESGLMATKNAVQLFLSHMRNKTRA